jgi:hypothetical protein
VRLRFDSGKTHTEGSRDFSPGVDHGSLNDIKHRFQPGVDVPRRRLDETAAESHTGVGLNGEFFDGRMRAAEAVDLLLDNREMIGVDMNLNSAFVRLFNRAGMWSW